MAKCCWRRLKGVGAFVAGLVLPNLSEEKLAAGGLGGFGAFLAGLKTPDLPEVRLAVAGRPISLTLRGEAAIGGVWGGLGGGAPTRIHRCGGRSPAPDRESGSRGDG